MSWKGSPHFVEDLSKIGLSRQHAKQLFARVKAGDIGAAVPLLMTEQRAIVCKAGNEQLSEASIWKNDANGNYNFETSVIAEKTTASSYHGKIRKILYV